jgi:transcriptional regulator with XRE-family HTH domain
VSFHPPPLATERIAMSLPVARLDHGLSQRALAQLSGVSATTIRKLESGRRIDPALLLRIGATLVVLDVYRAPSFVGDRHVDLVVPDGRWAA